MGFFETSYQSSYTNKNGIENSQQIHKQNNNGIKSETCYKNGIKVSCHDLEKKCKNELDYKNKYKYLKYKKKYLNFINKL